MDQDYRRHLVGSVHSEARGRGGAAPPIPSIYQQAAALARREVQISQVLAISQSTYTYVEYRAVSDVFQNIDPPPGPPSPPSECVLPPHQSTHSPGGEGGVGVNILEDASHRIGLLQ